MEMAALPQSPDAMRGRDVPLLVWEDSMKSIHLLAGFALLTAPLANPLAPAAVAQEGGAQGQELKEFCIAQIESGEFGPLNLGECMSFWRAIDEPGFAAHLCDAFRENDLLDDFGFDSYSDCVRNL